MITKKIKILIADDHSMIRNGLILMLENQNRFVPELREAENGKIAIEILEREPFDILLLDVTMPELDGITVLKKLLSKSIKIPTIMLTMHKEESTIKQSFEFGAMGYMLKNSGLDEIVKAILTVTRGERYFCNDVAQIIFNENKAIKESKSKINFEENLSQREIQILSLIIKEYNSQDIADELSISKRTIEWHRKNLLEKLQVKSTVGLVKFALKNGYE